MKTCYIACALDSEIKIEKQSSDLIIGADRGYFTLVKNGIMPDLAIGDFDSYTGEINCENIIKFPVKKDDTDSALAVKYAVEKGYKSIVIFGAIGGMLDHTIANISLIANYIKKGIRIVLIDSNNVLFPMYNEKISFDNGAEGRISVFSFTDVSHGVSEKGLLYSLDNYDLTSSKALGVSNEFIGEFSEISVKDGVLLIYTSRENFQNHLTD